MRPLLWVHAALVTAFVFVSPMLEPVSAQNRPGIVISEFRFNGLTTTDEFIEIFNSTTGDVNIGGWKIVGSTGGVPVERITIPADTVLGSGCFYLVAHELGYPAVPGRPPADQLYSQLLSFADMGDVAVIDANGVISDQVGVDPTITSLYQEPPRLARLTRGLDQSYERKPGGEDGHADNNNNFLDFRVRSASAVPPLPPNPQNSQSYCVDVATDDEPPVFDGEPADVEAEATSPRGAVVNYRLPTATDNVDAEVTVSCEPVSGSAFPLGPTNVVCSATDAAGNGARVGFTVTIHDTTAPDVRVPGNITLEATSSAPHLVHYEASASDAVTVDVRLECSPPSGSLFELGVTSVSCRATDAAGNLGDGAFRVTIHDTTAPLFTFVPEPVVAEATGPEGALVIYDAPAAMDRVDGAVAVGCTPASGTVFPLGYTVVQCFTRDAAGNDAAARFPVTVRDTTAPELLMPANIRDAADSPEGRIVNYSVSASDAVTAVPTITCTPASGSMFAIGTTTVNCQASDDAGNSSAESSFTITIGEAVLGRMHGGGQISSGGQRITFMFEVRESSNFVERGRLMLALKSQGRPAQLLAATVSDVRFSELGDSVTFSAWGTWNGKTGYRFDVAAGDLAEPGVGADTLQVIVIAPTGDEVQRLSGVLVAGNIQGR